MPRATAPGKMVLLGEYAVLAGAPAWVAAVDRRARVIAEPRASGFFVEAPDLDVAVPLRLGTDGSFALASDSGSNRGLAKKLRVVVAMLEEAAATTGVAQATGLAPMNLRCETAAFFEGDLKLGLGSSAAVAVALWGALCGGAAEEPMTVFERVLNAHRRAQGGTGSGVDVAASTLGGTLIFRRQEQPVTIAWPRDIEILAIWSGSSASTGEMVAAVERAVAFGGAAAKSFARLEGLAHAVEALLADGDSDGLLALVRAYQKELVCLGDAAGVPIVNRDHVALCKAVEAAGGAYKPSGAGGGDLGVAFANSPGQLADVKTAVARCGYKTIPLSIAEKGLEVRP